MSFQGTPGRERAGRPTQFHGVSLEERAFDAAGNRLPWALEFPDGHPNSRLARKQPDEKGSFGRSTKRKAGSTRGTTRTQTPARQASYPALDGFEAALKFDTEREPQQPQSQQSQTQASSVSQQTASQQSQQQQQAAQQQTTGGIDAPQQVPAARDAEPTQVLIYGYGADTQWAAINFYESASGGGMICEDYDRAPPEERRRFHGSGLSLSGGGGGSAGSRGRRTLTKQEAQLAMQYRGGAHWIKVTFDSREAAERAIAASPHLLFGHWAYAELWRGPKPERDEPIPMREDEQGAAGGRLGSLPAPSSAAGLGMARPASSGPLSPTLPFTSPTLTPKRRIGFGGARELTAEESPQSSTTASSATATGPEMQAELRQRGPVTSAGGQGAKVKSTTMERFPHVDRTVLKPASEALLPTLSWSEKWWKTLKDWGLLPGEIIGSSVPRLDSGDFDWERASYYWRFFRWLDDTLGTDLCGMKEL